jgi:hypothetical protein
MPMFSPRITPMIMPVQKFIKHLQIIGSRLIVVFGIRLDSFRTFYLILFSFQIILHGMVRGNMDDVNAIMVDPVNKVFLIASDPRNEF